MKHKLSLPLLLCSLAVLSSCSIFSEPVNTLPPHEKPNTTLNREITLLLPDEALEIISLKYDAELYTPVSDGDSYTEGERGRAFIIAHARHSKTQLHYLLVYENPQSLPVQIIRFQPKKE